MRKEKCSTGKSLQHSQCKQVLDTQVQPPHGLLNACQAYAVCCGGPLRIVSTSVNSRGGDFPTLNRVPTGYRFGRPAGEWMERRIRTAQLRLISRSSSHYDQPAGCNGSPREKTSVALGKPSHVTVPSEARRPTVQSPPRRTPLILFRGVVCARSTPSGAVVTEAERVKRVSDKYYEYLTSEAWKAKRLKRLAVDRFSCVACGRKDYLQVHHLSYERVYNEDIKDLMTLCELHHQAAEDMIRDGKLSRCGNVLELAHKTLTLICPGRTPCFNPGIECRNPVQSRLLSERWFLQLLSLPRKQFKRAIKARFGKYVSAKIMTNSMVIYHRCREQSI